MPGIADRVHIWRRNINIGMSSAGGHRSGIGVVANKNEKPSMASLMGTVFHATQPVAKFCGAGPRACALHRHGGALAGAHLFNAVIETSGNHHHISRRSVADGPRSSRKEMKASQRRRRLAAGAGNRRRAARQAPHGNHGGYFGLLASAMSRAHRRRGVIIILPLGNRVERR